MYKKEREEEITNAAYRMADKIYNMNIASVKNVGVDKDDFRQDAVMYILNKYRNEEMYMDEGYKPEGIIFTFLSRFYLNYIKEFVRKNRELKLLDLPAKNGKSGTALDYVADSEQLNSEELAVLSKEKERAEKLLDKIISNFENLPYPTRKYEYVNKENKKLSEYRLAKLIIKGYTMGSILKEYDSYTTNIGTNSKAHFINKKVHLVMEKLSDIVSKLEENDTEAIKIFADSL